MSHSLLRGEVDQLCHLHRAAGGGRTQERPGGGAFESEYASKPRPLPGLRARPRPQAGEVTESDTRCSEASALRGGFFFHVFGCGVHQLMLDIAGYRFVVT